MGYSDSDLRRKISDAVYQAFEKNPASTSEIIDYIFVQIKPLVETENKAYTIRQIRDMLTGLI